MSITRRLPGVYLDHNVVLSPYRIFFLNLFSSLIPKERIIVIYFWYYVPTYVRFRRLIPRFSRNDDDKDDDKTKSNGELLRCKRLLNSGNETL